jgi:uncharacterized protein (TIGR03435 family)
MTPQAAIRAAYAAAYEVDADQVELTDALVESLPTARVDIAITIPQQDIQTLRRWVELGLGGTYGVTARTETRTVPVYVLKEREPGSAKAAGVVRATVSTGGSSMSTSVGDTGTEVTAINMPVSGLADLLKRPLDRPVFDETGLDDRYDFELLIPDDVEAAKIVIEASGFTIEEQQRELTFVILEPSE